MNKNGKRIWNKTNSEGKNAIIFAEWFENFEKWAPYLFDRCKVMKDEDGDFRLVDKDNDDITSDILILPPFNKVDFSEPMPDIVILTDNPILFICVRIEHFGLLIVFQLICKIVSTG